MKNLIVFGFLLFAIPISGQEWSLGKDLSYLKGQKEILLKFTYTDLKVSNEMIEESAWLKNKVEELNEKEAGSGDVFAKRWVEDRANSFEPKFELHFNKHSAGNIQANRTFNSAKYTLVIHTIKMVRGFSIGMMGVPSSCDYALTIVETANPSVIISKGMLYNVEATYLFEVFAKCGKILGKSIGKIPAIK